MLNINVVSEELLVKFSSLFFVWDCGATEITVTKGMLIYHKNLAHKEF